MVAEEKAGLRVPAETVRLDRKVPGRCASGLPASGTPSSGLPQGSPGAMQVSPQALRPLGQLPAIPPLEQLDNPPQSPNHNPNNKQITRTRIMVSSWAQMKPAWFSVDTG